MSRARKPVNLSIDSALVAEARKFGLNISGLVEDKLREAMVEHRTRLWQAENAEAIAAYNRFISRERGW